VESISKIFSNGAFTDLNGFISKDKDFNLADYNEAVINSGVFNGRREFLPIYFNRQFLFTTESVLEQNGINIKDNCSIKELNTIITDFTKNKARKSQYLFDFLFDFYYLMNFNGESFLDYENRKCNFNSNEFKDLLRMYKRMQPVMASVKEISHYATQSLSMKNNVMVLATETVGSGHPKSEGLTGSYHSCQPCLLIGRC
jgi:ABC-type glycerol-3-phosphate transport system substrate-binding protein